MSSYSRSCKYCGRRINLRQMPHGQWVPFEGDQQHNCDVPPPKNVTPPIKPRTPAPAGPTAEPFKPLYPKVVSDPSPQPSPQLPVSAPLPAPQPPALTPPPAPQPPRTGIPTRNDTVVTTRPAPVPQPTQPQVSPHDTAPQPPAKRRSGIVETALAVVGGLLSSTFGLVIGVFALLSLPLNVIAVMHLFGWSWFGALVGVVIFSCVPFIGQLGYFILAVMGAYYVWAADFDWQRAAYPPTKTFSISTLSEVELERFKTEVVRSGFEKECKSEALKTAGFDGKLPARAASLCECFATNFAARLTRADMIAFEKTGRYPEDLQQRVGVEVRRACQN